MKRTKCQRMDNTEMAHRTADYVLCEFVKQLGYGDMVEEYEKVDAWFA